MKKEVTSKWLRNKFKNIIVALHEALFYEYIRRIILFTGVLFYAKRNELYYKNLYLNGVVDFITYLEIKLHMDIKILIVLKM